AGQALIGHARSTLTTGAHLGTAPPSAGSHGPFPPWHTPADGHVGAGAAGGDGRAHGGATPPGTALGAARGGSPGGGRGSTHSPCRRGGRPSPAACTGRLPAGGRADGSHARQGWLLRGGCGPCRQRPAPASVAVGNRRPGHGAVQPR